MNPVVSARVVHPGYRAAELRAGRGRTGRVLRGRTRGGHTGRVERRARQKRRAVRCGKGAVCVCVCV